MKKNYLFISTFVLFCSSVTAQEQNNLKIFDNMACFKVSENGKWAAGSAFGESYIVNSETGKTYHFKSEAAMYNVSSVSNSGIVTGEFSERAVYWSPEDEAWHDLPLKDGENLSYCYCGAEDGSFLLGNVQRKSQFEEDNDGIGGEIMETPVIWYRNSQGEYDIYQELPYTNVDWTGRAPQAMRPKNITKDGKTITGVYIDYSGYVNFPVTWTLEEDKWTYKIHCEKDFFKENAKKPVYPSYKPTKPDVLDYLTKEEQDRFNDALEAYKDSIEHAGWAIPEEERWPWPTYNPEEHYSDFFDKSTQDGVERHNRFAEIYNKYIDQQKSYSDSIDTFHNDFWNYIETKQLYMIDIASSSNGRYITTNLLDLDYGVSEPVIIDLQNDGLMQEIDCDGNFPTSVLNDGTVILSQPAVMPPMYRYSMVWTKEDGVYPIEDWIKSISPSAYEDFINKFETSNEHVMAGAISSSDGLGAKLCGFNQLEDLSFQSWVLDLTAYSDSKYNISKTEISNGIIIYPNPCTERIFVKGIEDAYAKLYDTTGKCVAHSNITEDGIDVSTLNKGIYIMKIYNGDVCSEKKIVIQ